MSSELDDVNDDIHYLRMQLRSPYLRYDVDTRIKVRADLDVLNRRRAEILNKPVARAQVRREHLRKQLKGSIHVKR